MRVGSLVECIKAVQNPLHLQIAAAQKANLPVVGETYAVRAIKASVALLLEEIDNSHIVGTVTKMDGINIVTMEEPGFPIRYFREVQPPMVINVDELIGDEIQNQL